MPLMDGIELVRAIRADALLRDMALVMVTGEVAAEAIERALVAGADDYLPKPATFEVLAGKLGLLGLLPGQNAA